MAKRSQQSQGPSATPGRASGVEVLRSEEQLKVGTEVRVSGRAVLRKYVVTETVTQTFQVRREEVRLEHDPAPDDARTEVSRVQHEDAVVEMVLHREVPRVVMDVVAVERVRLHVDSVTTQVSASQDLRKEQVVVDSPHRPHRDR